MTVAFGRFVLDEQARSLRLDGKDLVLQPLVTWFIAFVLLDLPPFWAHAALLLSALPTGTGPFMLAEYYQRQAALVSRAILFSTLGSLLTLSLILLAITP